MTPTLSSAGCTRKKDRKRGVDDVESHCVTPLTTISAALLAGVLPGADDSELIEGESAEFAVIASDMHGSVSGVIFEVVSND